MSAHTALPWRFKPSGGELNRARVLGPVHPVDGGDYAALAIFANPADAQLTARAVNSHADLVAALAALANYFEVHTMDTGRTTRGEEVWQNARATLAKAEGRG